MDKPIDKPILALANSVAARYGALPQVEAVALAGSQTTRVAAPGSDIDLYVYWQVAIPLAVRRKLAATAATHVEVDNNFWEPGDEWIDVTTGIRLDVMFRHTAWIEAQLERVLGRHEASVGYSTCFWHNVATSEPLFDRHGWFAALQDRAKQPYPEKLRQNIIAKNHPILRDSLSAYLHQIGNAERRGDRVSLNHRIAALLASYFDILFAINGIPHPGEKRLLEIAAARCAILPAAMPAQVNQLLDAAVGGRDATVSASALIESLDALLRSRGLLEQKAGADS